MSHGPTQSSDETLSEVNVIPLADLSLVLLIILMVLSPMIMQSMINVQASRAAQAKIHQTNTPEPPLILLINPDGSLVLNTIRMNGDLDFVTRLEDAINKRDDKTIMITTDPAVQHGRFVHVLDMVKQHGVEKIALLKKAAPAPRAPGKKA